MAQECGPSSPVGLTFAPSDEQLVVLYLQPYAAGLSVRCDSVVEAGVYSTEPWSLLGAVREIGYFLTKRTRHGKRVKRTAGGGTWTGQAKKQEVVSAGGEVVGFKALLSFCIDDDDDDDDEGCSKKPHKKTTGYVMYEYELPSTDKGAGQQGTTQEPVLCCVKKSAQEIARSHKRKRAEAAAQAPTAGTSTAAYAHSVDKRARHPTQISEAGLLQHENSNVIASESATTGFADSSTFTDEEALALAPLPSCQFAADPSSALLYNLSAAASLKADSADAVNLVFAVDRQQPIPNPGDYVVTTNGDFFEVGECSYNTTIPEYTDSVALAGFGTFSSTYAADYNIMPLPTMAWMMTDDVNLAFHSVFGMMTEANQQPISYHGEMTLMMNADRFDGLGGDRTIGDIVSTTAVEGAGDLQPPSLLYELTGMTTMAAAADQQLFLPPDQDKQTAADDADSLDQLLSLLDKEGFPEWFDSLLNAEPSPPPLVDAGMPLRNCRMPPPALLDGTASSAATEVATTFTPFSC